MKGALEAANITLNEIFKKSDWIVSRRIAGEAVLVPIHNHLGDLDSIYALNETAALVWDSLDGILPLNLVLERLTDEFDVDQDEGEKDLLELISDLRKLNAVEKV